MNEDNLILLLLILATIAAHIVSSLEMAIKSLEEPQQEPHRAKNSKRLRYIYRHREEIKLGMMQLRTILTVMICYLMLYTVINGLSSGEGFDFEPLWLAAIIIIAATSTAIVLFVHLLPSITFQYYKRGITGAFYLKVVSILWIFYPISRILVTIRNSSYSKQLHSDKPISMEELSDAVEIVSKVNTEEEKRILSGMARFANAAVEDIMCHRTEIVMIDYNSSFSQVKELFLESGFSRIPVFKGNSDNIQGIIHLKDMLPHLGCEQYDWHQDIYSPLFANNEMAVNKLLLKFQSKKEHMAIVVDEYGSTLGLATLEDVLEEIVGEIDDEFDEEEEDSTPKALADGAYIVEGKCTMGEFAEMFDIDEELFENLSTEIDTVAGLIVELLQDFPKVGSSVTFNNEVRLTVISTDRHRIDRVRVEKITSDNETN